MPSEIPIGDSLDAHEYRDSGDVSSRSRTIVFVASIKKRCFEKGNSCGSPLSYCSEKRSVEKVFTVIDRNIGDNRTRIEEEEFYPEYKIG